MPAGSPIKWQHFHEDMIGQVDAVILARDDYENHFAMAMPFLEAGLAVFIDKPLTLDIEELRAFRPYLESGRLFSCSGMRYARELDDVRASLKDYGALKLVRGAVLNSWEKYGVHLLDAVFSFLPSSAVSVSALEASHFSVAVSLNDGCLLQIDALGQMPEDLQHRHLGQPRPVFSRNHGQFHHVSADALALLHKA